MSAVLLAVVVKQLRSLDTVKAPKLLVLPDVNP